MIMKKNILLMCALLSTSLNAQQLYFIRANPCDYGFREMPPVQIILYAPKQDSMLQVQKDYTEPLNTWHNHLNSITYYPKFKTFSFLTGYDRLYLLRINQLDTLFELLPQCPDGYDLPSEVNVINDYWTYDCFNHDASEKKNVFLYKGLDVSLTNYFDIPPNAYKNIYLTGAVAQRVELKPNDGRMYLPIVADIENRPPFSFELPQKYWVSKESHTVILVNDDQKALLFAKSVIPAPHAAYGYFYATLYNKRRNTWSDIELKGCSPTIMTYGSWLAGAVQDKRGWGNENFSPQEEFSPGKAARDSVFMECSFDEQASNSGFYRPGLLYLFNTETEKYIEWDTKQGDSEILLVQDEVAYYRVFDAIYQVAIIKGEKLGTPELLVKDKHMVPSIHWAFFGKPGKPQQIAVDKSIIYSQPNKPTKMYLVKGDVVTVREEKEGWLRVEYEGKKLVTGWIKKEDTK
jgi:hypothetical protein